MVKYLIPLGSITGDPPGTQRFMECDSENPCTAANTIVISPRDLVDKVPDYESGFRRFESCRGRGDLYDA